ncbi:hypothetical protein Tco_0321231 [Tanacetum coccineum]
MSGGVVVPSGGVGWVEDGGSVVGVLVVVLAVGGGVTAMAEIWPEVAGGRRREEREKYVLELYKNGETLIGLGKWISSKKTERKTKPK